MRIDICPNCTEIMEWKGIEYICGRCGARKKVRPAKTEKPVKAG